MPTSHPGAIASEMSLEYQSLRVTLRLEVESAHPAFLIESHLSDLRKNAEACLPGVLATEAPPVLRQILEKAEALLIRLSSDDLTRCTSANIFPATTGDPMKSAS